MLLGHARVVSGSPPSRGRRKTSHTMSRCVNPVASARKKGIRVASAPLLPPPRWGRVGVGVIPAWTAAGTNTGIRP
jgi:hypothetical protein